MNGVLLAMPVGSSPRQALITLPHGTKVYGPLDVRGEYAEFVWDSEKYKCHVDEFAESTAASLRDIGERNPVNTSAAGLNVAETESKLTGCTEQRRLLGAFGETVQELLRLHEQQFSAIVAGDLDSHRFDLLIHMANEKKQQTKYAYLQHVETHSCLGSDATDAR